MFFFHFPVPFSYNYVCQKIYLFFCWPQDFIFIKCKKIYYLYIFCFMLFCKKFVGKFNTKKKISKENSCNIFNITFCTLFHKVNSRGKCKLNKIFHRLLNLIFFKLQHKLHLIFISFHNFFMHFYDVD
jgi:hypothetical protein